MKQKARDMLCDEANLVIAFIELYDVIGMEIAGTIIWPTIGGPQGHVLVPIMFCMYLNDILQTVNTGNPEVPLQAFVNAMLQQAKDVNLLQRAFENLIETLDANGLVVNTRKCELVSDNPEDCIINVKTGDTIKAKDMTKYVGQHIGSGGKTSNKNK